MSRRVGPVSDDDREAVRQVQAGDREAFEPLVEKYKRKVFRLAYQVLRDQEEALDVAQEAFVKAFRALPAFKGDSAFYTWLFRITMNVALDRKRQRTTRVKSLGAEDVPPEEWERTAVSTDPDPEDVAAGAERRERIRKGLDSLSEHHRTIIILSDIEGLQYREIAEVLGIPMGTVMSRLHHARKRLRDALGPGFAVLLAALAWLFGAMGPAQAQLPPMPPPGVLPPAVTAPGGAPAQEVCVYALVMFASSPAGGTPPGSAPPTWLAPTPDLANPAVPRGRRRPLPWIRRLAAVMRSGCDSGSRVSRRCSSTPTTRPSARSRPGCRSACCSASRSRAAASWSFSRSASGRPSSASSPVSSAGSWARSRP